jgi:hypothetical protein
MAVAGSVTQVGPSSVGVVETGVRVVVVVVVVVMRGGHPQCLLLLLFLLPDVRK